MNEFLDARWVERVDRLALGLELLDACRAQRVSSSLDVAFDGIPDPLPRTAHSRGSRDVLERVPRHPSCVHALLRRPGLKDPLALRVIDPSRRFVPRRLSIPLPSAPVILRAALFPGAAYDLSEAASGVRARVLRASDGSIVRWTRAEARLPAAIPGAGTVVGRAHGDDRGELLLLIDVGAATIGDLVDPLELELTVFGTVAPPVPSQPDLPGRDPLWDLPLEDAGAPAVPDGTALPVSWAFTPTSRLNLHLPLGRLTSLPDILL